MEHGFYISKPTGLTRSDLGGITLSLTAGEFEDYQGNVCILYRRSHYTTYQGIPTRDVQYTYTFEYPFKGDAVKNSDNSTTHTNVDLTETFWDSYTSATLGGSDNFYIRWFLKNKSTGVETYIANAIRNVNGATTTTAIMQQARYGRFWSTKIGD